MVNNKQLLSEKAVTLSQQFFYRYKKYNGPDGNSPASQFSNETYSTTGTTRPDVEDINRDNTLSESERYFQYKIELRPDDMEVGSGYITDMREGDGRLTKENGDPILTKWYQFKIPIKRPNAVVGSISDFKSIRFMRMFMKGFEDPVVEADDVLKDRVNVYALVEIPLPLNHLAVTLEGTVDFDL